MTFPLTIREEALVKSGRRCCVCHEFAGRSINVHHIIPEADNGPNTLDNAIALCLKCHSEAGHYNPRHPIGTKYSPMELRKHRDSLWQQIKDGRLSIFHEVRVTWKRIFTSIYLHTQRLIVNFHNCETSPVAEWRLLILIPSIIPVRVQQNIELLPPCRLHGIQYGTYKITGISKVFPGEDIEIIGKELSWLEYDINEDLYNCGRVNKMPLRWKLFLSSGAPIEGTVPWSQLHEF